MDRADVVVPFRDTLPASTLQPRLLPPTSLTPDEAQRSPSCRDRLRCKFGRRRRARFGKIRVVQGIGWGSMKRAEQAIAAKFVAGIDACSLRPVRHGSPSKRYSACSSSLWHGVAFPTVHTTSRKRI